MNILYDIDNKAVDEKIIAIPFNDLSLSSYKDINELPPHLFDEIKHFFKVYKFLEHKVTVVEYILGSKEAEEVILKSMENYRKKFGGK